MRRDFALVGPDLMGEARQGVYFVRPVGRRFVKVGHGCPIVSRIADIQCGSPEPLEILLLVPGGRSLERECHRALYGCGYRGEWFRDCEVLRELIGQLSACTGEFQQVAKRFAEDRLREFRARVVRNRDAAFAKLESEHPDLIAFLSPRAGAGRAE